VSHIPGVWAFALIGAASYRLWLLLAEDSILDRPRRWIMRLGDWEEPDPAPALYRAKLGEFVACPWCFGFWIAVAWWAAWLVWEQGALVVATPFALSAVVGGLNALVGFLTGDD
jgi:Protein of unknown function (DUF1360)